MGPAEKSVLLMVLLAGTASPCRARDLAVRGGADAPVMAMPGDGMHAGLTSGVTLLLLVLLALYLVWWWRARAANMSFRAVGPGGVAAFLGGWLVLVIALDSPLAAFSERLFSVHMVQHELLMAVAAPLLVLGLRIGRRRETVAHAAARGATSRQRAKQTMRPAHVGTGTARTGWRCLTHPALTWSYQAIALWGWHAPVFFCAAMRSPAWHALEQSSFLITALLFWYSLLLRDPGPQAPGKREAYAILALFTTMTYTGILGALFTFSPRVWYPLFSASTLALGGTPLDDQRIGGLIMWIAGSLPYLGGALAIAWRLLSHRATA